jgi:hypothetical protein
MEDIHLAVRTTARDLTNTIQKLVVCDDKQCNVRSCVDRGSVFGIVSRYGLGGPGIESWWGGGRFCRTRPHRVFFSGVKRPGRGVSHPPHLALRLKK